MTQQKALIISDSEDVRELNNYFKDGWTVFQMCPMPSSTALGGASYLENTVNHACLVIIGQFVKD